MSLLHKVLRTTQSSRQRQQHVVVVGGGFGGLEVAKALGKAGLPVTLVDCQNHYLFQPLLYQVATAALSAVDVAEPIRKILRPYRSVRIILGKAVRVMPEAKSVMMSDGTELSYDLLVLACGASHSYFGHEQWARLAPGLKTVEDARRIRTLCLLAFENAERATDPDEQRRLITIAIVGGGPTGVELAGALAELSRFTLVKDFRNVAPETASIILLEAGPRILPAFSREMSEYAEKRLKKLGVEVKTNAMVEEVGEDSVRFSGQTIATGTVLWAAGVAASSLTGTLGVEIDKSGRIPVAPTLEVPGLADVYAIGDVALCLDDKGNPLPGLAQVAKQQGRHLGRGLVRYLKEDLVLTPFNYRGRGNAAIIGRHAAVFEQGAFKIKGFVAWLAWAVIHVYLLVGAQHRMQVALQWLWRYVTYEHGARLLTHVDMDLPGQHQDEPDPTTSPAREGGEKVRQSKE